MLFTMHYSLFTNPTKRVVAKSTNRPQKLTKPPSVFYIIQEKHMPEIEAIYHNVGNQKLNLFSFDLVSKKPEKPHFTKRIVSRKT
jgi:hypothetical protein